MSTSRTDRETRGTTGKTITGPVITTKRRTSARPTAARGTTTSTSRTMGASASSNVGPPNAISNTNGDASSASSQSLRLSELSTPPIPDSSFFSQDFRLGAGMVVFQPSTDKVLLVYDDKRGRWFLPKGRKDRGESLETAALREAYEETGYTVEFLPITTPTLAPSPQGVSRSDPHTEPFYLSIYQVSPSWRSMNGTGRGCEYFVHWYIGQIGPNAVRKEGTGMSDEQGYRSYLLTYEEALAHLKEFSSSQAYVLSVAWRVYSNRHEPWRAA